LDAVQRDLGRLDEDDPVCACRRCRSLRKHEYDRACPVRDDGIAGARPGGSVLLALADRLAVLDGRLRVESPADGGMIVVADIPAPPLAPAFRTSAARRDCCSVTSSMCRLRASDTPFFA